MNALMPTLVGNKLLFSQYMSDTYWFCLMQWSLLGRF